MMFKEIAALTGMSLRGIPDRPLAGLVTIVGVATMVAVMTALLALGTGLTASTVGKIGPDMAVVTARGAASDYMGSIPREAVNAVAEAPGVKQDRRGQAQILPSSSLTVNVVRQADNEPASITLVGVPVDGLVSVGGIRVTKGRVFKPGLRELIVGRLASGQYRDLAVGDRINLRGGDWTVVGEYESGVGLSEGGLYGDADTIMAAFNRTAYQQIQVRLSAPGDFGRFKQAVVDDPRYSLDAEPYREYVRDRMGRLTSVINFVGYFVGTVMGLGAFFGILNTMYAAIDARRREFATLRAIGFGRSAVLVSITIESLALALPGALIGAALAWLLFDGHLGQISDLAFPVAVTPGTALAGVLFTVVIALLGGLVPSVMSARQPIATALRAT